MSANISTKKNLRRNQGFTLIEIVITIVILGFSATILIPFFSAITNSPDPVLREQAISLGQAMMDEIMAKRWDENSPVGGGPLNTSESARGTTSPAVVLGADAGEDRMTYDDVDDYNNLPIESDGTFADQNGNSFTMTGYTRKVEVRYIVSNSNPINKDTPAAAAVTTDTKLVVMTVKSPRGETFTFVAVACNI